MSIIFTFFIVILLSPIPGQSQELEIGNTFEYKNTTTSQGIINQDGIIIDKFTQNGIEFLKVFHGYGAFFQSGIGQKVEYDDPEIDFLYFSISIGYTIGAILLGSSGVMISQYSPSVHLTLTSSITYLDESRVSTSVQLEGGGYGLVNFDGDRDMEYCTSENYVADFSEPNVFSCLVKFVSKDYEYLHSYEIHTDEIIDGVVSQYLINPSFNFTRINPKQAPHKDADNLILHNLTISQNDVSYKLQFEDIIYSGQGPSDSLGSGWVADYTLSDAVLPQRIQMKILKGPGLTEQRYDMTLSNLDFSATFEPTDTGDSGLNFQMVFLGIVTVSVILRKKIDIKK